MKKLLAFILTLTLLLSFTSVFAGESLYEGGTLKNESAEGETKEFIETPGLKNKYIFSGHVKIVEIGNNPWNGIRIVIGANEQSQISALVLTKEWGVRVEFIGDNMSDYVAHTDPYGAGDEFDFTVTKDGADISLELSGTLVLELTIPEGKDAFAQNYSKNLGFVGSECMFEVSNISVTNIEATENPPTGNSLSIVASISILACLLVIYKKREPIKR